MISLQRNSNSQNYVEVKLPAMGSHFIYKGFAQRSFSKNDLKNAFNIAHKEVLRIQNKFSEFTPSIITKINENAGESEVEIDDETYYLLRESKKYFDMTNGVFDISFAGFKNNKSKKSELDSTNIYFDEKKIFLKSKNMKISLGGIGKGYAVDLAFKTLENLGFENFYVNGSGDIRVHSRSDAPRKWRIGLKNPFNINNYIGLIQLSNESVCTSGTYIQGEHISLSSEEINEKLVSASIIDSNCVHSDVMATTLIALGKKKSLKFMEENKLMGLVITQSGEVLLSKKSIKHFGIK